MHSLAKANMITHMVFTCSIHKIVINLTWYVHVAGSGVPAAADPASLAAAQLPPSNIARHRKTRLAGTLGKIHGLANVN